MTLIVVESPTKARTFNRILEKKDYFVFATLGHIRDLPVNYLAIDHSKNFKPDYRIIGKRQKVVTQLKELGKKNEAIILATDPDREGESIAYHVAYLLGFVKENWPEFEIIDIKNRLKRIVFHEITKRALAEALKNPTELRTDLIKAQLARRILDRLVGYELSPLLWKKTGKNWLSAGRVQTVVLRLIVEREKEIKKFSLEKYFQVYGYFEDTESIKAKLIKIDSLELEQTFKINLFAGEYQYTKTILDDKNIKAIKNNLEKEIYVISQVKESTIKRYPPPPFTTSLLQQEGFNRFGFSSKMVMKLAQDLYERGLITYHRTDSFNLSTQFVFKAKEFVEKNFGQKYALEKPRGYHTKSRLAQEAHEAIRPTNLNVSGDKLTKSGLTVNHKHLYQLIFNRALVTQMKEAEIRQIKVFIASVKKYLFESDFQQVLFDGFLKVLNPEFVSRNKKDIKFKINEPVALKNLEIKENFTQPPPRYNEASLIKILEEKGIGRPSTYAPIISLIQEKGYVEKENRYFIPTFLGESISNYLATAFPNIFEINFTASMENNLDEIAEGNLTITSLLSNFYGPFKTQLELKKNDHEIINIQEEATEPCPKCGKKLILRYSKFGKFYACTGYPSCKFTKPFLRFVENRKCPKCGGRIVIKFTKSRKRFYGCENYPNCDYSSWKIK